MVTPQPASWVHWSLQRQIAAREHDDLLGEIVEASWRVVHQVLRSTGRRLVVPDCQLVLRALLLEQAASTRMHDSPAQGKESASPEIGAPPGNSLYWLDPRMLGWLCDPDASEQDLLLPRLYATYLLAASEVADEAAGELHPVCHELRRCCDLVNLLLGKMIRAHGGQAIERILLREVHSTELAARMEICGLAISPHLLTQHLKAIERRQAQLTEQAEQLMGRPLNLASAQQVSEALYLHLKLPPPAGGEAAKAKHGSTSEAHLLALEASHPDVPLARHVLEHRELAKLRTTFLEPYATKVRH